MFRFLGNMTRKIFSILSFLLAILLAYIFVMTIIYPLGYRDEIIRYSNKYEIDPFLVAAIIDVESNYNKLAVSSKDARGLMQIGPNTGAWALEELGYDNAFLEDLYKPELNINIGTWYLDKLRMEFGDDRKLILAAYNAGSGNLNQWLNDPEYCDEEGNLNNIPFNETKNYVEKVNNSYDNYKKLYGNLMYKEDKFTVYYFDTIIYIRGLLKKIINKF